MKPKTAHEKKIEIEKAKAPQYGIYVDGANTDKLIEIYDRAESLISMILSSDSEEKTKRDAFRLLNDSVSTINHMTITGVSINMDRS